MPNANFLRPKGVISPESKKGTVATERDHSILSPLFKKAETTIERDHSILIFGQHSAGEPFFRLTERGDYRIVEDNLSLRVLEEAP